MFYYPNVLQRQSGCFSTIWLAATKGVKISRRELLRVNVKTTCLDILRYITAQVPPPQQNYPKPRFSLYLSAQLQYGVVVVYHRQCGFLLVEIQQTIDRLLRSKQHDPIDIQELDRLALDLPDNLMLMEQAEGAQDPFFGLMESHQLPSPYKQPGVSTDDLSSDLPQKPTSHSTSKAEVFISPPASITLREREHDATTSAEHFEGAELPEATNQELDLLMDQQDEFRLDVEEHLRDRKSRLLMSSIEELRETVLDPHQDSAWLQEQETGQTVALQKPPLSREMTPENINMSSSSTEAEEEVIVRPVQKSGRSRKRQLIFADPETQISTKELQEQIKNPMTETLNLAEVLLNVRSETKYTKPALLFSAPCGSLFHPDLKSLWKQSAVLTALSEPEEDLREQEREILMTERKRRRSTMRKMSIDSGLQPVDGSSALDVALDSSKEDRSVSNTPTSRWSPQEDGQPMMEPIAEENIDLPEAQTAKQSSNTASWIVLNVQRSGQVTFDSLLPPQADRSSAAHYLYRLLELLSAGQVKAQQTRPYRKILVSS